MYTCMSYDADVAQLVEQRFCKPPVMGSSPFVGSGNGPGQDRGTRRGRSIRHVSAHIAQ